ncbi:MAG: hypothetical protein ETSY2_40580 [Candidatus Entotheonella gemina]|uniref:Resolvase n=1 Tax=Candidatus Entotheonella gemina TaxID=1429439 RepID=W4LQC7_9BACT|nr:MAG: hypothetical protein ETSY2_40580 [Candidatus Entotheonella gemina]
MDQLRYALYMRVSTEDQAERQTIEAQRDFLRSFTNLYQFPLISEYADEGISGTVPLSQRPSGNLLLQDARARRFECILVYRVDRLGRSLAALLDAYHLLSKIGVSIRSATEPFDTATPIGTFLFQLLGSLAELEKSTIVERMTLGRDRVARNGKWGPGIVPFGYDTDDEGCLTPSTRMVESAGMTEAELVCDIFRRLATDSTTTKEARRLNNLGVPTDSRYANGTVRVTNAAWSPSRIALMVHKDLYAGTHTLHSAHGDVTRDVPALIDDVTLQRARNNLKRNTTNPKGNAKRRFLLGGLITCDNCGSAYTGTSIPRGKERRRDYYYKCNAPTRRAADARLPKCGAKHVKAEWLEDLVWEGCRHFIRHPGDTLAEVQRQLSSRLTESVDVTAERQSLGLPY